MKRVVIALSAALFLAGCGRLVAPDGYLTEKQVDPPGMLARALAQLQAALQVRHLAAYVIRFRILPGRCPTRAALGP